MTWARRDPGLTLRNARFRDQIATLAAAIREVPKEEIEGEDVRQQRRTRRIAQAVIATLTVLVLLASVLAVVANIQRRHAVYERDVAISGQLISQSELLGDTNPVVSRLLSVAAWRLNPSNQARYAMLAAATRPGMGILSGHTGWVWSVAFSPDGKILARAALRQDTFCGRWPPTSLGRPLAGHTGHGQLGGVQSRWQYRGLGGEDGTMRLWDVASSPPRATLHGPHQPIEQRWRLAPMARSWPRAVRIKTVICGTWRPTSRWAPPYRPHRLRGTGGVQSRWQDRGHGQCRCHDHPVGCGEPPAVGRPLTGHTSSVYSS